MSETRTLAGQGDDWLDDVLRAEAHDSAHYIGDDGFTAKVMAALPAAHWTPAWRKPLIVAAWALVAVAALVAVPGAAEHLLRGIAALIFGQRLSVPDIAAAIVVLVIATWSGIVYAARTD